MTGKREGLRLLLVLSISVFVIEAAIMTALNFTTIASPTIEALVDASSLTILLFPALYFLSFKRLVSKNRALAIAETRLRRTRDGLERRVEHQTGNLVAANERQAVALSALEERRREIEALSEMVKMLQACRDLEETYTVARSELSRLFPGQAGALYVMKSSRNLLDRVLSWGEDGEFTESFAPDDCWALRFGKPHYVGSTSSEVACSHVDHKNEQGHLCLPINAYGEAIGALCLHRISHASDNAQSDQTLTPERLQFFSAVAENLAFAIANMRLRQTLSRQALHDPLTGLFNRRYLLDSFDHALDRAESLGNTLSLAMFDIDHFKRFNDEFGHDAGDAVLSTLGSFLQNNMMPSDLVARYGGEEFVVVMDDGDVETAARRMDTLRQEVAMLQVKHDGQMLRCVSISVGVSSFPRDGEAAKDLIQRADAAMYEAKKSGRNKVVISDGSGSSMHEAVREAVIDTAA